MLTATVAVAMADPDRFYMNLVANFSTQTPSRNGHRAFLPVRAYAHALLILCHLVRFPESPLQRSVKDLRGVVVRPLTAVNVAGKTQTS